MSTFPSYVAVSIDGYSETPSTVAARTDMDRGVAKQRRTQSDVLMAISLKLIFESGDDAVRFEAWYYSNFGAGAGMTWFDWTDPRTGVVYQARAVANTLGPLARMPDARNFELTTRTLQIEYLRSL